jgi:predicted phage tail protein
MDRDQEYPEVPAGTTAAAVFALMPTSAVLNEAIKQLETAGFDRADLSLPEIDPPVEHATPEAGAKEPDTGIEAQQSRVMHSGVGSAIGAMMAGVATAATGGAAAAIAGAAIGGGLLVGGVAHMISRGASEEEQEDRDRKAAAGKLVLSVRAPDAERQARAAAVLRAVGATRLW